MEVDPDHGAANPRRCAACKYLRRRCAPDCVLAPYFPASRPQRYADVHAVFGTSNVTRVLQSLPVQERGRAADTMATEAHWRVQDPVYGCAGIIDRLQEEIRAVQLELASTRARLAMQMQGMTQHATRQGERSPSSPPPPPPLVAPPAAAHTDNNHRVAVHEEGEFLDPDEFLDLNGQL
ncbi:LOB domain-containing protein 24-like [Phragmites australis]|uniref:LOB domain-containing protein 24-like n=1 Tax=Phragmites australis TaxID=29695 RepID=UPI002D76F44D|nr:LOB domain-containing protein 24-like [Phragmites australis]